LIETLAGRTGRLDQFSYRLEPLGSMLQRPRSLGRGYAVIKAMIVLWDLVRILLFRVSTFVQDANEFLTQPNRKCKWYDIRHSGRDHSTMT